MHATKQKEIDPNIYLKPFLAYAKKNDVLVETENLMAWDTTHNDSQMRQAIFAKYGEKALVEIAIKELFKRYLYNGLAMRIVPSSKNPEGLKNGVPYVTGVRKGIHIPTMTVDQQEIALADAKARFVAAGRQLKVLGLPLAKLVALLEEI